MHTNTRIHTISVSLLLCLLFLASISNVAEARDYSAKLLKCIGKTKSRCRIEMSPDAANSLLLHSQRKTVQFKRRGKVIFTSKKSSIKSTNNLSILQADVVWKIKGKKQRQITKRKTEINFDVPAKKLAQITATPISSRKSGSTFDKLFSKKSTVSKVYYFFVHNIGMIGFLLFASYLIYNLQKVKDKSKKASQAFKTNIKKDLHLPSTLHPIINAELCAACGSCVKACPEGEIIQLINHKAVLVNPTKCVGHSLCQEVCPYDAIDLVFGTEDKPKQIPKIAANYETNVAGMYIAGELGGMGLIGNAVRQGTLAAHDAIKKMKRISTKTDVDMLIVGAGPAGLAMACAAAVEKINYLVIEQNTFGGTINNFPKGKVVMNRPCEFPGYGKTKFSSNKVSKEALLEAWYNIRKTMNLKIKEKTKFETLQKEGDIFVVKTTNGDITAKKLMLAMGVGGSPRKLNLSNEDSGKVAYRLIDAADYQKKNIAVVGGGNSALESAYYLSDPKYNNQVILLVRKDMSKSNQENQDLIAQRVKQGRLKVLLKSSIKEIKEKSATVSIEGKTAEVPNDNIFVFAGAVMPWDFLEGLGIKIELKTGKSEKWAYTPEQDHERYKHKI